MVQCMGMDLLPLTFVHAAGREREGHRDGGCSWGSAYLQKNKIMEHVSLQ